ncbi:MAG: helix-turn-helix domain-containing protein [Chloroflexi bacterium]|nr:MAG: helix-turn-helix domain-containing protein [Chloroflexota bacterium]
MILMGWGLRFSSVNRSRRGINTMINKPGGGRFAFVDAGEAARILGIDRVTLDQWVRDGRIKPHRGVGRDSFYRTADLEALYKEMHPEAELAEAIAADERESAGEQVAIPVRKKQDPQMRVYLRLQADAKWYDTSEEDIRTWFQQLAPDGYERNKKNAEHTIKKLQYLVSLIEEAQGRG